METIKWQELKGIAASCEEKTFLKAIEIWLQKPHVVNRRLAGAVILYRKHTNACQLHHVIENVLSKSSLDDGLWDFVFTTLCEDSHNSSCGGRGVTDAIPGPENSGTGKSGIQHVEMEGAVNEEHSRFELCLRKLVPRQNGQGSTDKALKELIIIGNSELF